MIFIGIVLFTIYLYVRNYKIPALLLFFFFVTSGFNLIPEEITKFAFISKGSDYAFLILIGIIIIDGIFNRGYFNLDNFTKYLILFASFLFICIFYNKFAIKLGWSDILRTCRYQFFWLAYFIFRYMPEEALKTLLKWLFFVTLFTAFLYLLQIILDKSILLKANVGYVRLFGYKLSRFYNQPDMLFFFTFMALYQNPLKGVPKYLSMILLTAALLGAFHRSLIGTFIFTVFVGYIISFPYLKRIYFLSITSIILLFTIVFMGFKFVDSRTYSDVKMVMSGNLTDMEIDVEDLQQSTFTFRILHLLERNQYLMEHRRAMIFGAGLIPEDSKLVDKMFDFKIGLVEELTGVTNQLETSDISYSNLLLRLGYVGTFLYLLLIVYLLVFFYKKRNNDYGLFSFLYLILSIGVSFFSANLTQPITFLMPLISYNIIKKSDSQKIANETMESTKNEK